jgi:hypothetical protein
MVISNNIGAHNNFVFDLNSKSEENPSKNPCIFPKVHMSVL